MQTSWNHFCTTVEHTADQKLGGLAELTRRWTLDDTPSAGFFALELHSAGSQAWLRFREKAAGVAFQFNDGPWCLMARMDDHTIGRVLSRFLRKFKAEPGLAERKAYREEAAARKSREPKAGDGFVYISLPAAAGLAA